MKEERVRKLAAKALVAFVAIMALLTWTSRALTDMTVANVSVTSPVRGTLEQRIDVNGTLVAASYEPVFVERSARVKAVPVTVGAMVNAGDVLFTLDTASAEDTLVTENEAYQKQLLSYEKSKLSTVSAESTAVEDAQRTLSRAYENKETTIKTQDDNIASALKAITEAETALDKARRDYSTTLNETMASLQQAVDDAQSALSAAQQAYNNAQNSAATADPNAQGASGTQDLSTLRAAIDKAQNDLNTAQNDLSGANSTLEKKMDSAKTAVDNAYKTLESKQEAYQKALEDKEKAVRDADRSIEDAQVSLAKGQASESVSSTNDAVSGRQKALDSQSTQIDIAARERTLEELKAFIETGGAVTAPVSGRVMSVSVSVGSAPTTNTICVEIATGEYVNLKAQVTSDEAELLEIGGTVTVRNTDNKDYDGVILEINEVAGNAQKREVVVSLPGEIGQPGDTAQLRFRQRTAQYDAVLSLSALRSDSDGDFILVASTESGAMGTTTTARRVDIEVLEQDSSRMAVRAGIGQNERVITRSDRSIADGDRIYVEE